MLLRDIIARLKDDENAAADVIARGDIALMQDVSAMADAFGEPLGDYLMSAVRRFSNQASSDDWLKIMGEIGRVADPGAALILAMAQWAVREDKAELSGTEAEPASCAQCGAGGASQPG